MACTEIILVRHGETDMNLNNCLYGITDVSLNKTGIEQAHILKGHLEQEDIDFIISSDLLRAVETANIINEKHLLPVFQTPLFREMNFGIFEGDSYCNLSKYKQKEFSLWLKYGSKFKIKHGDRVNNFYNRVIREFKKIIINKKYHGKTILIVAHGGVIRSILSYIYKTGVDNQWRYGVKNCEVFKFSFKGGRKIR